MAKVKHAESLERLREWLKPGDTLYTVLDSVSRSGMSRHIRVVLPYIREDGTVDHLHPNHAVAEVLGYRRAKRGDGLVVGGCGMDMGFHVVEAVSSALYGYLRCENPKCKRSHPSQHTRYDLTARPACEACGEALAGGYPCLGKGTCPSNYHVNHRDRVRCEGIADKHCYRPYRYESRWPVPDNWPEAPPIDIGEGQTIAGGLLACIRYDHEAADVPADAVLSLNEDGTPGDWLQVCPTCQGAGDIPNPDGPERFDLLHTDGYAIRHRWL
jgi:hypothetical protein